MSYLVLKTEETPNGSLLVRFIERLPGFNFTLLIVNYGEGIKYRVHADFEALQRMDDAQRVAAIAKMRLELVVQPVLAPQKKLEPVVVAAAPPSDILVLPAQSNFWLD